MGRITSQERDAEHRGRVERDAEILESWLNGESTTRIARRVGLSPERVRRIVNIRRHRDERQRRQESAAAAHADLVQSWSHDHPGIPYAVAVEELGLPAQRIRELLGERLSLHLGSAVRQPAPARVIRNKRPQWSDGELGNWVELYFARAAGPWSLAGLEAWLREHPGAPSCGLVRSRVGGWPVLVRRFAGGCSAQD